MKVLPMAKPSAPPFTRIAIVGYGLIGGSLGLAIKEQWPGALVIAVDRKDVIEAAMRGHAADVGGDDLVLAAEAELVVLAAPVRTNLRLLDEIADHVPGEALVTDVGSTKREMAARAAGLPARLGFVGGHPLAGAATGGFAAARGDLFRGRPWILTPRDAGEHPPPALLELLQGVGAEATVLAPEAHDALVAYLSHLPQLAATALMGLIGDRVGEKGLALAGRGLRDTTRLAASPPGVWSDILATNRDNIHAAVDALIEALEQLKNSGDERTLSSAFESAAAWKRILDRRFEEPS